MKLHIIKDYSFMYELVKEGLTDKKAPFILDGICFADNKKSPNNLMVCKIINHEMWILYAWTNRKDKRFYRFYRTLENFVFCFDIPVLRKGSNSDIKKRTILYRIDKNGDKIYKLIKGA